MNSDRKLNGKREPFLKSKMAYYTFCVGWGLSVVTLLLLLYCCESRWGCSTAIDVFLWVVLSLMTFGGGGLFTSYRQYLKEYRESQSGVEKDKPS